MDPRFKLKMDNTDAIWDRLRTSAVAEMLTGVDDVFESQPVLQFHWDAMYSGSMNVTHIVCLYLRYQCQRTDRARCSMRMWRKKTTRREAM